MYQPYFHKDKRQTRSRQRQNKALYLKHGVDGYVSVNPEWVKRMEKQVKDYRKMLTLIALVEVDYTDGDITAQEAMEQISAVFIEVGLKDAK